jgi:hypothetical protein
MYWHVIVTKNTIRVSKRNTNDCIKVGSLSCYTTREGAIAQANTKQLK